LNAGRDGRFCRAKFIVASARAVREAGGNDWLLGLRQLPYEEVRDKLLQLMGVGRKVADCVALFSLDKTDAVPVDTHVWDITQSLYAQHLQKTTKSLTPKMYDDIRGVWRQTFGSHSGWAQAILFAGELTRYRQLLQDNGCAPALGVAIKEERKEAAASLPNSPLKAKSPKETATSTHNPSSVSQKVSKAENSQLSVSTGCAYDSVATAAAEVGSTSRKRVAVRVKLEVECDSQAALACAAAASVEEGTVKKVKRERR
jgi:N-glycosylase/DNA lyase